jgi:hypothetical protein
VIAIMSRAHPEEQIDAKVIGAPYRRKVFRGRCVYMVHAKTAVMQELVASTLRNCKTPVVPWRLCNAANKEVADMERGLRAFKEAMAKVVGEKLSSNERRSPGLRYWNGHKDILKSIADAGELIGGTPPHRLGGSPSGAA